MNADVRDRNEQMGGLALGQEIAQMRERRSWGPRTREAHGLQIAGCRKPIRVEIGKSRRRADARGSQVAQTTENREMLHPCATPQGWEAEGLACVPDPGDTAETAQRSLRARAKETVRSAPTTGAPDGTEPDKDPEPRADAQPRKLGEPWVTLRHSITTRRPEQTSWSRRTHPKELPLHRENVSTEPGVDEVLWVT